MVQSKMEPVIIKFGKYKGQSLENMLKDTKYLDWIKTTDIPEKHPYLQQYLFPDGAPRLTSSSDEIPDEILDNNDQEELIKRLDQLEEENRLLRLEIQRLKYK